MAAPKYANQAQQRILKALIAIVRSGYPGLTPGEVAAQVGTIPSNATRDLANLVDAGLVERNKSGRFTVSPLRTMIVAANAARSMAGSE